jgi:purine-binding chemotaxis protein CheW
MDGSHVEVGVLVDSVQAVLEVEQDKVLDAPSIGERYRAEFIEGIVQSGESFVMLLDMDRVFSSMEVVALKQSASGLEEEVLVEEA